MLLLLKLTRRTVESMLKLAHDVPFFLAKDAFHAIAFSTVIRKQHSVWVLKLEPSLLAGTKYLSDALNHGILEKHLVSRTCRLLPVPEASFHSRLLGSPQTGITPPERNELRSPFAHSLS
jgi:hypothetical protein